MSYVVYGINTASDSFKKKPNAALLLWEKARNIDWIKDLYDEYCDDNGMLPDEEAQEAFVEDYESNDTYAVGFEGLLLDVINELTDPKDKWFRYDDYILGVAATLPENDTDRAVMLTQQKIREILADHVNPLLEEPVVVQWHTVEEE